MTSHILLAVCRYEEVAFESTTDDMRGFFTKTLVEQLCLVNPMHTMYADLMNMLPELINQKARREGNQKRFLFNSVAAAESPSRSA
jgi:hypothetical protein